MAHWPNSEPQNIMVRMPNWLGDMVMATPVLADLKKRFPQAKISCMCLSNLSSLLKYDPNVDEIFAFKRPSGWLHRQSYRDIILPLKHGDYDLGVLLTNSLSSAWWFWQGHVRNRIGYAANGRSILLNKAVPFPATRETQHLVITYKMLLEPLGISVSETAPKLYVSEEEKQTAKDLLKNYNIYEDDIIVGINPGAAYGSAKCWLPERFKELTLRLLNNPKMRIVYFGDPAGAPLVHDICSGMPERVVDLAGKTSIRELIALIEQCNLFLTNDSGPMHIAAALQTPLLALFGSTSDVQTSPYKCGTWIHKQVSCSPCYKRTCPIDFRCMTQITVDEVYTKMLHLLGK